MFFIFPAVNSIYCQDNEQNTRNYRFSLGTQFGFIYGQSHEIVYPASENRGKYLSELIWEIKPLYYYGAYLDFGRIDLMKKPGFFASLSYKIGVPGDTGIMEDRDWRSMENGALTNFSSHTNRTNEYYSLDAVIGSTFPVFSLFYIKPFISGSWMSFSFTGRDGKIKYARKKVDGTYYPIDDDPITDEYPGNNISYTQNWFLLTAGVSIGRKLPAGFSAELSFKITPLTYCAAQDDHLETNAAYLDYTTFGLFVEPAGKLSYTVNRLEFSLEAAYRYISNTRGPSYNDRLNEGDFHQEGEAGASLSFFNSTFMVTIHF